ncbi:MAG TPA: translation initiation factor IF-1 [Candidatus Paceibacterota bacterium]
MVKGAEKDTVSGVVVEAMPNTLFRVKVSEEQELMAYLSGRMRLHRIKVLVGDTVLVEIDPYGGKGRIVKRT